MSSETYSSRLVRLSLKTLPMMIIKERNLFCLELKRDDMSPYYHPDRSVRYSIMALLGLTRARRDGLSAGSIDIASVYNTICSEIDRLGFGNLGLLLWLDYRLNGALSSRIVNRIKTTMESINLDRVITMELAWLLVGLSHHVSAGNPEGYELLNPLFKYFIENRIATSGLVYHSGNIMRRRFPNFATQIYTIHAFSIFARLCNNSQSGELAMRIAKKLCTLQRDNGGWPWIYDADLGRVVEPFEIYAVHQHAMAPMAFHELTEATKYDTKVVVAKGLQWLDGHNELGVNMVNEEIGLVYRSIRRKSPWNRLAIYSRTLGSVIGISFEDNFPSSDLEVNFTSRPYCFGWLLEAWCDRSIY